RTVAHRLAFGLRHADVVGVRVLDPLRRLKVMVEVDESRFAARALRLCVCFIRRSDCACGQRRNTRKKLPAIDRAAKQGGCSRSLFGHTSNLQMTGELVWLGVDARERRNGT